MPMLSNAPRVLVRHAAALTASLAILACDPQPPPPFVGTDAGPRDGGGTVDGAVLDGSVLDGSVLDGSVLDGAAASMDAEVTGDAGMPVDAQLAIPDAGCELPSCGIAPSGCYFEGSGPCSCGTMVCLCGAACGESEYCDAPPGCGAGGACAARPSVCTDDFMPVCGCDGATYPNACAAHAAGMAVASEGDCAVSSDCRTGTCPTGTRCLGCEGGFVCLPDALGC